MSGDVETGDLNQKVISEFRANEGRVSGQITGLFQGQEVTLDFDGSQVVLVHHVGAKSGKQYISPLAYLAMDGRIFVFASKGGSPTHPAWYYNMLAKPDLSVELGTETFDVVAKEITGPERDRIYAQQVVEAPQFGEYERMTTRRIPVVELVRTGQRQ